MDQQFSLSWNNFHGNLSEGFAGLLGKNEFVDVTIAVEGHLIQAHKVILSICSPYFKEMFHMSPCQHPIVVLRDVSHKIMKDLLQFMYLGEVSVKREDLSSFIGTAELLQIKGLTNKESDEGSEKEQDLPKHQTDSQNNIPSSNSGTDFQDDMDDGRLEDEASNHAVLDLLKQREFAERLQRLSNLKRKSEEFLHKNYYNTEIFNFDKRPKLKEKPVKPSNSNIVSSNYEHFHSLFQRSPTLGNNYSTHKNNAQNNEENELVPEQAVSPEGLDIKTECDDGEIIVTEPSVCTTPKSFDTRDGQKDAEYQPTQENSGVMDVVNGKGSAQHCLVTIPQRAGKKKYPQRSCRRCWRLGRRRDTRFMCRACQLPLCKLPCFLLHAENAPEDILSPPVYNFPLNRM